MTIVIAGFAFADDTDIVNAAKSANTKGEELLQQQQRLVNKQEDALRFTGGALKPEKSQWYMLDYKYFDNTWAYKAVNQLPG